MNKKLYNIVSFGVVAVFAFTDIAMAKMSSNAIRDQKQNIEDAIAKCNFSDEVLMEIKNHAVGSTVASSIATAGSLTATITSGIAAAKNSKNAYLGKDLSSGSNSTPKYKDTISREERIASEKTIKEQKSLRWASTIASGIATGANLVSMTLSAGSSKKLKDLIKDADECSTLLENITIQTKTTTSSRRRREE